MKIVKLTIHNFLKLKDIEMNPSKTNIIVGKNKQGKTSILKAIKAAFDGGVDEKMIRIGENKAEILLELDEFDVKRTITEKGTYLDVANKEGYKVPSPQKFLNNLLGVFSFNPVQFFELKLLERKKYLLNAIKLTISQDELAQYTGEKLAGIDYGKHALEVVEDARKYYYDKRTAANSEVSKKRKTLEELSAKIPEGFNPAEVNEKHILELRDSLVVEALNQQQLDADTKSEARLLASIEEYQKKIKEAEYGLLAVRKRKEKLTKELLPNPKAVQAEIERLESQRELVFTAKRVEELRSELGVAVKEADKLDVVVNRLTKEIPQELIMKAKLPVEGLVIVGDDVQVNGVSLDNLSASEQLKFALDIVRKLNENFKIICIDGIETLDKDSFEVFLKEIENDSYQYFVTRVNGEIKNGIIIENGEIRK